MEGDGWEGRYWRLEGVPALSPFNSKEYAKEYYKKNKKKFKKYSKARYIANRAEILRAVGAWKKTKRGRLSVFKHRLKTWSLTIQDFMDMRAKQQNKCAICAKLPTKKADSGRLHVDHDHKTNKVRGLLCAACNRMLGQAKDSSQILEQGAIYLRGFLKT